jgi:hypothetical protein
MNSYELAKPETKLGSKTSFQQSRTSREFSGNVGSQMKLIVYRYWIRFKDSIFLNGFNEENVYSIYSKYLWDLLNTTAEKFQG